MGRGLRTRPGVAVAVGAAESARGRVESPRGRVRGSARRPGRRPGARNLQGDTGFRRHRDGQQEHAGQESAAGRGATRHHAARTGRSGTCQAAGAGHETGADQAGSHAAAGEDAQSQCGTADHGAARAGGERAARVHAEQAAERIGPGGRRRGGPDRERGRVRRGNREIRCIRMCSVRRSSEVLRTNADHDHPLGQARFHQSAVPERSGPVPPFTSPLTGFG